MLRLSRSIQNTMGSLGISCVMLSACATAASTGDDVIRKASFGRIAATPFTDRIQAQDCRAALDSAHGFTRESRTMKNGVFVVQAFDCKADRIVVEVSLNNYTSVPMHCYAETESGISGVTIAPKAAGFFEYSHAGQAYQDCRNVTARAE
jgi:hypothetical protein